MDVASARPHVRSEVLTRPAVAVAAVASVAAAIVHAAAAGNHEGDALLTWMFGLCSAAQLGWGVAVAIRPRRRVLLAGLVINGGALLVWALTRTVGIPAIDSLAEVEAVGQQDLGAALFASASVAGALRVLVRPIAPRVLTMRGLGLMAAVALVAALPAAAADHSHEHAGVDGHGEHGAHDHEDAAGTHADEHGAHDHEDAAGTHADEHGHGDDGTEADGHGHGDGGAEASGHGHGDDGTDASGHGHGDGEAASGDHGHSGSALPDGHGHPPPGSGDPHPHPADPDDPHPHPPGPDDPDDPHPHPPGPSDPDDPIISLDDPRLTDEQWSAAVELIISTTSGMSRFTTEEDVLAAGYVSIGDGGNPGEYEHFVNWSYLTDAFELDPAHIESVVMKMNADGTTRVVSAMYILTLGKTMADVPTIAGELTTWHDHDNLCFDGTQLVALATDGVCPLGVLVNTPPMLHVWVEANPCGPFAGIDEHGLDCGATHTH